MTIRERFEALHFYSDGDDTGRMWTSVDRDDVLALADALDAEDGRPKNPCTGAEFVAAMQAVGSPCRTDE